MALAGSAPIEQSGLATGCYRYRLQAVNEVGRVSTLTTVVRVDRSAPVGGAITINGVAADVTDTVSDASAIGWSIERTAFTDPEWATTGTTLIRASAPYGSGTCGTFTGASTVTTGATEGSLNTGCYRYVLTGTNTSGLTSQRSTVVRLDRSVPTGGALTVNGVAASAAGTTSTSTTGTTTVTTWTAFVDNESGMVDTVLTRLTAPATGSACGTFVPESSEVLTGSLPITQTGLEPGCYRYVLTGRNVAGGLATVSTTVRVDTTASPGRWPSTAPTPTPPEPRRRASPVRSRSPRPGSPIPESTVSNALTRATFPLAAGGAACGAAQIGSTATVTGQTSQSGLGTACYRYVLTGTNSLLLASSVTTVVRVDSTRPQGGALTVNGTAASAGGTSSSSVSGNYAVTGLTPFTDADTGIAETTLTVTPGVAVVGGCGAFDEPSTSTLGGSTPIAQSGQSPGCYRYTLRSTNGFGASASVSTTVRVGP